MKYLKIFFITLGIIETVSLTNQANAKEYCINNLLPLGYDLYLYSQSLFENPNQRPIAVVKNARPYKELRKDDFPLYASICAGGNLSWSGNTASCDTIFHSPGVSIKNYIPPKKIDKEGCYDVNYSTLEPDGDTGHLHVLKDPVCACKIF